jgi:hypothetical protein
LSLLVSGRGWTLAELARELGVDARLLPQMLADLARAGYVREVELACSEECHGCAKEGHCGLHLDGRLWSLTAKAQAWRLRGVGRD